MGRNNYRYRKIWIDEYGEIPLDEEGRSYHIHHIDGDSNNNRLSNLICISPFDHYMVHLSQGDIWEASRILGFLGIDKETHSKLISKWNKLRVECGSHNFLIKNKIHEKWYIDLMRSIKSKVEVKSHHFQSNEVRLKVAESVRCRISDGSHNFLKDDHSKNMSRLAKERVANGTHNFQDPKFKDMMKSRVSKATKGTKWYHNKVLNINARMKKGDSRLSDSNWVVGKLNKNK